MTWRPGKKRVNDRAPPSGSITSSKQTTSDTMTSLAASSFAQRSAHASEPAAQSLLGLPPSKKAKPQPALLDKPCSRPTDAVGLSFPAMQDAMRTLIKDSTRSYFTLVPPASVPCIVTHSSKVEDQAGGMSGGTLLLKIQSIQVTKNLLLEALSLHHTGRLCSPARYYPLGTALGLPDTGPSKDLDKVVHMAAQQASRSSTGFARWWLLTTLLTESDPVACEPGRDLETACSLWHHYQLSLTTLASAVPSIICFFVHQKQEAKALEVWTQVARPGFAGLSKDYLPKLMAPASLMWIASLLPDATIPMTLGPLLVSDWVSLFGDAVA